MKERIARALRIYKEAAAGNGGGGALVQVWAPARDGGRRVLATRGQPFVLAPPQCHRPLDWGKNASSSRAAYETDDGRLASLMSRRILV